MELEEESDEEIEEIESKKWKLLKPEEIITYEENIIYQDDTVRNIPSNLKTPYDFYSLFIDDNFINKLVQHTNDYAHYKKEKNTKDKTKEELSQRKTLAERWTDINLENMEKYLASIILMGLHHLPEYKDHFSKDQLLGSPI